MKAQLDVPQEPQKIDLLGKLSKNFEMQFKDIAQKQRQQSSSDLVAKLANKFASQFSETKKGIHLEIEKLKMGQLNDEH